MSASPRLPRQASDALRSEIIEALRDPSRRFLDSNTPSRRLLDRWVYADLADGLEDAGGRLFLKPKTYEDQLQRYQCVLCYPKECCPRQLMIHVTLSPRGEPLRVKIAVHESNTVHTLPALYPYPQDS